MDGEGEFARGREGREGCSVGSGSGAVSEPSSPGDVILANSVRDPFSFSLLLRKIQGEREDQTNRDEL